MQLQALCVIVSALILMILWLSVTRPREPEKVPSGLAQFEIDESLPEVPGPNQHGGIIERLVFTLEQVKTDRQVAPDPFLLHQRNLMSRGRFLATNSDDYDFFNAAVRGIDYLFEIQDRINLGMSQIQALRYRAKTSIRLSDQITNGQYGTKPFNMSTSDYLWKSLETNDLENVREIQAGLERSMVEMSDAAEALVKKLAGLRVFEPATLYDNLIDSISPKAIKL